MKRVERYRLIKKIKRKYAISILLFFLIICAGFSLVDNSLFWIYGDKTSNRVFSIQKRNGLYEIIFLNKKYKLDLYKFSLKSFDFSE